MQVGLEQWDTEEKWLEGARRPCSHKTLLEIMIKIKGSGKGQTRHLVTG